MSADKSMQEHEPSANAEQPFGAEKIGLYLLFALGLAIMAALIWWAAQAA
jgi:hypothetical protein